MTTSHHSRTTVTAIPRPHRAGLVLLIAGGAAFFAGGPLHPAGGEEGDRTEQLHAMLVDPAWYPAHLVSLLGFSCVSAGLLALRRDPVLRAHLGRLLPIGAAVAVVTALGAVVHLFAATQAAALEHGAVTPLVGAFMGVETVVNPAWGLTIAALAVVGGLTRSLGNRIVLAPGLIGGLAFAVASGTIAFVDTFDPLFPVAGLAGVWLVSTGVVGLSRRPVQEVRS